jgi:signal peptidase I
MTEKQYPNWVGVLLGFLLHGSAHFLSGSRVAGLKWYFGLLSCGVLVLLLLAIPGTTPYVLGIILLVAGMSLLFGMLKQSYRPVRRIGFLGWLAVIGLSATLDTVERSAIRQVVRPFQMPNGAMQPTIFGIRANGVPADSSNRPSVVQWFFTGRRFHEIKVSADGTLSPPRPSPYAPSQLTYMVGSRPYQLPRFARPLKQAGEHVSAGETLWSGIITAGDHLFAERLSYRFGKPKRGDIVVFSTDGIESLPPDRFYIKRVAGLPGERISIEPPFLIVNGQRVTSPAIFETISTESDGYTGFQLAAHAGPAGELLTKPSDEVVLGKHEYFVLGDNPRDSLDSRYWGAVPENNIIGKATRIYWPFTRINDLTRK